MKTLLISLLTLGSLNAMADGLECTTVSEDLNIKVYNKTNPAEGTRNPAVMIVSDPQVQTVGRKSIAVFRAPKTLKTEAGMKYVAKVDLRFNDSKRKGENILGTKLGHLKTIALVHDFSYSTPVAFNDVVLGQVIATKRNGDVITEDVRCLRYLKN